MEAKASLIELAEHALVTPLQEEAKSSLFRLANVSQSDGDNPAEIEGRRGFNDLEAGNRDAAYQVPSSGRLLEWAVGGAMALLVIGILMWRRSSCRVPAGPKQAGLTTEAIPRAHLFQVLVSRDRDRAQDERAKMLDVRPNRFRPTSTITCRYSAYVIEGAGARTQDLRIKSPLLYRLSYAFFILNICH